MDVSFPGAKIKFIGSGWDFRLLLVAFIFIHSYYYKAEIANKNALLTYSNKRQYLS